jgi:hypothetical protein
MLREGVYDAAGVVNALWSKEENGERDQGMVGVPFGIPFA